MYTMIFVIEETTEKYIRMSEYHLISIGRGIYFIIHKNTF